MGGSFFVFFLPPSTEGASVDERGVSWFPEHEATESTLMFSAPPWMICLAPIYTPGWRDVLIRNGSI